MQKLTVGNWKMNGTRESAQALVSQLSVIRHPSSVILCPPSLHLSLVAQHLPKGIALGAQDCSPNPDGAQTGDVSAAMLKDAGCTHVIVGHSERRQNHAEADELVRAKAEAAIRSGLIPIICIGETREQRERGGAEALVAAQAVASIPQQVDTKYFIIAYEPVWAIGTGLTPTLADIDNMHRAILAVAGPGARVLYGGSVKAANAAEIMAVPTVAGVLVGGASLNASEFSSIVSAAVLDDR